MSLVYENKIFVKKEFQKHSGGKPCSVQDYPAEGFYVNKFVDIIQPNSPFFAFDTPMYTTLGGTLDYYNQDPYSVFTNISRPFIRFNFTANTQSFGTGTTIVHEIYRVPYDVYSEYASELKRQDVFEDKNTIVEDWEETVQDMSGGSKTLKTSRKTTKSSFNEKFSPNSFPSDISMYDTTDKLYKIKQLLSNPVLTISASTSAITTNTYNLFLAEDQKQLGGFKFQLFQEKAQYFIKTTFDYLYNSCESYSDFYNLNNGKLNPVEFQTLQTGHTLSSQHIIQKGKFVGVTVTGNFFTYFLIPNKPDWSSPLVENQLTTFSPTFYWKNAEDGDSFLLQVVYNVADSTTFSGTVYSYPILKSESNLSTDQMLGGNAGDWAITQQTTDVVRQYSVPLSPKKTFWYRMGNVKEITNIFGVKQQVITFSEIKSATTAQQTFKGYILVGSDSPYTHDVADLTYPDYLDYDINDLGQYVLSGTVTGSIITGATMQLVYPNSNFVTLTTDSVGGFLFSDLEAGTYTLNTSYRGYQQDSRILNISGDTSLVFNIELVWGNNYDTWGNLSNEIFS